MNIIYRLIILLLVISFTACTSTQQRLSAAYDEDKDIGLGGTGLLAVGDEDEDGGLGGTGILGKITGYGSIFVNGVEIEYDSETPFTVDGKAAPAQQLEIGNVVEVLTTDSGNYTQARMINLRHEVIGRVDSVEPDTFSFTVDGQSIVQAINASMPKPGESVAVSGFRVDEQTIVATRVDPADTKQTLLRTDTSLPFPEKTTRWLVQAYVQDDKAVVKLDGIAHVLTLKEKAGKSSNDGLNIQVLQLQETARGQLKLKRVIESKEMPRGKRTPMHDYWRGGNGMYSPMHGSGSEAGYGRDRESAGSSGSGSRSGQGSQSGKH